MIQLCAMQLSFFDHVVASQVLNYETIVRCEGLNPDLPITRARHGTKIQRRQLTNFQGNHDIQTEHFAQLKILSKTNNPVAR